MRAHVYWWVTCVSKPYLWIVFMGNLMLLSPPKFPSWRVPYFTGYVTAKTYVYVSKTIIYCICVRLGMYCQSPFTVYNWWCSASLLASLSSIRDSATVGLLFNNNIKLLKPTSGAIREAFPPLLTHMLLKGSCRLESLWARQQPKSVITKRGQPPAKKINWNFNTELKESNLKLFSYLLNVSLTRVKLQQHVVWFEIPVSNALSAQVVDPLQELQHHQRALPAAWRGRFQVLSQRAGVAIAQKTTGY